MSITITHPKESLITTQAVIRTKHTLYALGIFQNKFPVHLYYGKKSRNADLTYRSNGSAFAPYYPEYGDNYMATSISSEFSTFGMGDFRAAAIRVRDLSTGSDATEFSFRKMKKYKGRAAIHAPIYGELPYAEADGRSALRPWHKSTPTLPPKQKNIPRHPKHKNTPKRSLGGVPFFVGAFVYGEPFFDAAYAALARSLRTRPSRWYAGRTRRRGCSRYP